MKSILISIKPKWVAKILNDEKTIEIRKTMPKCGLPIDVYIYCTKESILFYNDLKKEYYSVSKSLTALEKYDLSGKVVAKFTLNKVEKFDLIEEQKYKGNSNDEILKYNECIRKQKEIARKSCLSFCELICYCDTKALGINQKEMIGYAWHISNLEIFDKPKELSELKQEWYDCGNNFHSKPLTKAPQSWCYVEELV